MIPLMMTLTQTTVNIVPLIVTLMQTVLVLTIPEANDSVTDNVEAADADIYDADSSGAYYSGADNADSSNNSKYGVSNNIDDNDYVTDTINPYID